MEFDYLNKKRKQEYSLKKGKLIIYNKILDLKYPRSLNLSIHNQKRKRIKYKNALNCICYYHFINLLLIIYISLFLPRKVFANYKITLRLVEAGDQQIFSDEYNIEEYQPAEIRVNGRVINPSGKNVALESADYNIEIEWSSSYPNLSYMFADLTFENENINISYMFYNCKNLDYFSIVGNSLENLVTMSIDAKSIFYNCSALTIFKFSYHFNTINNYFDFSYMLYNCYQLNTFEIEEEIFIKDMRYMFYNCISIISITLPLHNSGINMNMTRTFYNCFNAKVIEFKENSAYYPNDIHEMFYNCTSLENLNLINFFHTNSVINMSYLFYNCSLLSNLSIDFANILTQDMTGIFQNCKSLVSLNLDNFGTSNSENMSKMFSGCSNLVSLNLNNFNTSKVINMDSMFEGCSNLISLSLVNFKTSTVENLSKMFADCTSLTSIDFKKIDISHAKTMEKMFYNCQSLQYLNLFNIHEKGVHLINDMFTGTSGNFTFCISEKEYIPTIFTLLLNLLNTERDCSSKCYGVTRYYISEVKACCAKLRYAGNCYQKCPSKTHIVNDEHTCEFFDCTNPGEYYNYEQNNCTTDISGYYVKNEIEKTIDKCHEDCLECKGKYSTINTNCTKCKDTKPYIYLGNCYENCTPGFYLEVTGEQICKCFDTKCELCSEESIEFGLCISCNMDEGFYQKENDPSNYQNWVNCYKNPDNYFFEDNMYKECYQSCKHCESKGDNNKLLCISCKDEYSNGILIDSKYNCYSNCINYYYYDENNEYHCTNEPNCPPEYKLINNERKCIKSCNETENNKYEYRGVCYNECPPSSFKGNENDYFCKINCPFEMPFEMVQQQICTSSCTIMERYLRLCITNYFGVRNNEVQNKILENIQEDILDEFDYNYINQNNKIIIEELYFIYEITNTSSFNLGKCENILKEYYNISPEKPLYILKIDDKRNGILQFLIYYPLNSEKLVKLDFSLCEGIERDGINNLMLSAYSDENKIFSQDSGEVINQITNSKNELELLKNKSNNIYNISIIDLGDCEKELKIKYNISENDSLIFIKNEIKSAKASEKNIKFNVYNPYDKTELNLSYCGETTINIYFPIELSQETKQMYEKMKNSGYDIFNINDPFYQDICTPFDSPDGTDILLTDRIDYIYNNNDTQCQPNCYFSEYSIESQYLSCSCSVNEDIDIGHKKSDKFNP